MITRRQHKAPYLIHKHNKAQHYPLERYPLDGENFLQEFIFTHPETLPVDEIEPAFTMLIPVCRELGTSSGSIDNVFINSKGYLTLVECKRWINPESRRKVIAQLLDYAKDIHSMNYEELEQRIKNTKKGEKFTSLYDLVKDYEDPDDVLDEPEFHDAVTRNLRNGRMLLLVIGDGIKEDVQRTVDYMQNQLHLSFALALIEIGMYRTSENIFKDYIFVQPRVVAQTVEIGRMIFQIEDGQLKPVVKEEETEKSSKRHRLVSEEFFYNELSKNIDPTLSKELNNVLDNICNLDPGYILELGDNSIKLKYESQNKSYNFGVFTIYGDFKNYAIAFVDIKIGRKYLDDLATLLGGIVWEGVKIKNNRFRWTVKKNQNKYFKVKDILDHKEEWITLIQGTVNKIIESEEDN